jgi:hypothetical protein
MSIRLAFIAATCANIGFVPSALAQGETPGPDPVSLGTQAGMAIVILLAVLIGLSVLAKLLIVFGVVPRRPESGFHALVHAAANFVGGLTRPKPRRRLGARFEHRRRG